jgi:nitrogen regulatory protein P-II 1
MNTEVKQSIMKEVRAYIQPHMLDKVIRGLHSLELFPGFTLHEATGQGHGMGPGGTYRPEGDEIFLHRRVILEVICTEEMALRTVESIQKDAHTGRKGDGIITVRTLDAVLQIRTGEFK